MKRVLPLLCSVLCVLCVSAQVNITVGPYLQSPTSSSIKVMWRTDSAVVSKVMYGTDANNLTLTATGTTAVDTHIVQLTGLAPYTKYYYAIYEGNTKLEGSTENWFRTFPTAGTEMPIRVWAIGDFGKGNEKQRRVREAYENFDTTETNLWIWLGDNVYNSGTEQEYRDKVFDSVYGYKKMMKHQPFLPCPGNHDYEVISPVASPKPPLQHTGPYYDFVEVYRNAEAGGVASGHELFYSFDYGNVHFVSLNSEVGAAIGSSANDWTGASLFSSFTSSPMTQWLHQDLQANTKPWVVVYFHQTPYTDGSHDSGQFWEVYMKAMRKNFAPIWEQYGVDLVVCGHTHVYERSYLVKGAYGEPGDIAPYNFLSNASGIDANGEAYTKYTQGANANQGTVYVNCGHSGSSEGDAGFNHPYMYSEYGCDTCCGSFVLDINGGRLDGRHLDMSGTVRDHFTIYKVNGTSILEPNTNPAVADLKVVPNPFKNSTRVQFELKESEQVLIQLTDVGGKTIELQNAVLNAGPQNFDIDADRLKLAAGAYILKLSTKSGNTSTTVIRLQ